MAKTKEQMSMMAPTMATVSRLRPISPLLLANTLVALKKMPLPMTMPTTMEIAVNRPYRFCIPFSNGVPSFLNELSQAIP